MDKYVSREKMMALFNKYHPRMATSVVDYWTELEKLPTEDVEPVKHGRWIHEKDKRWMGGGKTVCSVCESGLSDGGYIAVRTFSYCPECGAKMDGGKNV